MPMRYNPKWLRVTGPVDIDVVESDINELIEYIKLWKAAGMRSIGVDDAGAWHPRKDSTVMGFGGSFSEQLPESDEFPSFKQWLDNNEQQGKSGGVS